MFDEECTQSGAIPSRNDRRKIGQSYMQFCHAVTMQVSANHAGYSVPSELLQNEASERALSIHQTLVVAAFCATTAAELSSWNKDRVTYRS